MNEDVIFIDKNHRIIFEHETGIDEIKPYVALRVYGRFGNMKSVKLEDCETRTLINNTLKLAQSLIEHNNDNIKEINEDIKDFQKFLKGCGTNGR